jgi:hypothetical protein
MIELRIREHARRLASIITTELGSVKDLERLQRYAEEIISQAVKVCGELQNRELRDTLALAVIGSCRLCHLGGNSDRQNHFPECKAGRLLGDMESRAGVSEQHSCSHPGCLQCNDDIDADRLQGTGA